MNPQRIARTAIFIFSLFLPSFLNGQIINTVAGNGVAGYSGDGGPATSAQIAYPWGLSADGSGNFYISDDYWWWGWGSNSRVRKVDASGIITTYAGNGTAGFSGDGGPATAAQLYAPMGLTNDVNGNLYISDYGNYRIRKVTASTGIITTIAGNGTWGYSGDGGPATAAAISNVDGDNIAVDPTGNLYFYNWTYNRIRKIDTFGIITTIAGTGTPGFSGDGGPASAARIGSNVYGLACDASGNVYYADWNYARVRMINTSGIISTVAGNGAFGSTGDGGAATAAQIGLPIGVAADNAGNIYIADDNNNRVRKVDASGIITTFAGTGAWGFFGDGGMATAAKFQSPYSVATDGGGNVYISDFANVRVRKVSNTNRPPYFTGGLSQNLVVCANTVGDSINSLLAVMDSDIAQTETWHLLSPAHHGTAVTTYSMTSTGGILNPHAMYYTPSPLYSGLDTFKVTVSDGYALDTITIYVTVNPVPLPITGGTTIAIGAYCTVADATPGGTWSSGSTGIATVGSTGVVTGISSGTATITYTLPTGCIMTTTVNVYPYSGTIITTIAGNGTAGFSGDGGAATAAKLYTPWGAATDASGNVYIADKVNNRVRKVSPTGIISTIAGTGTAGFTGDGGQATAAQISGPFDVAVDGSGNIYIADDGNNRVRKINASGIISTVAGNGTIIFGGDGGPATAAGVWGPSGIALDASGNLYICSDGTRVRKVNTSGTITTFAGNGGTGYTGDGGAATAAQMHNPVSVTVDATGNVFITDQLNNVVRKVNTSGTISTYAGIGIAGYSGDGGAATSAKLNNPWGIIADALGNIYIGDHLSDRVRKVSPAGIITTYAGNGTAGFLGDGCAATAGEINNHWGICTDGTGAVYIADGGNNRVRKVFNNRPPVFIYGHRQTVSICQDSPDSLNTILSVIDFESGQAETWSTVVGPTHGTLVASYSTTYISGTMTPVGLYYMPTTGYTGTDSFTVQVYDCGVGYDTTKIIVTITPPPSAISGSTPLCAGLTTTYTDPVGSGTWSSSNPAIATVGSSSGIVTGVSAGSAVISYSPGAGCFVTKGITINAAPAPISGNHNLCLGSPISTLTDATGGGTWSSTATAVATITPTTGVVTAIAIGSSTISYVVAGCPATFTVTVNPVVFPITGFSTACIGFPQAYFESVSGVWSSSNPAIGAIDSFTGVLTGVTAGIMTVSYTAPSGCSAIMPVTINPLPAPITGPTSVCAGSTVTLSDATIGGAWSIFSVGTVATVDSFTGVVHGVTAGSTMVSYTDLGSGCYISRSITVSPTPLPITGSDSICIGATTALADATPGGSWSSVSSGVAIVGSSGLVTGVTTGTSVISYSVGSCAATTVVTVSPAVAPITGSTTVCVGLHITLSDLTTGGAWSSGSPGVATISSGGLVTGVGAGVATITYTAGAGCIATRTITVNTTPSIITGLRTACIGSTTSLSDSTSGGTWSSSTPTIGSIGSTSGILAGLVTGTTTVTYTLGGSCSTTAVITVNPLPGAITGLMSVCVGSTTTLGDASTGGTWTASGAATIGSSSGVVTGSSSGLAGITYTLPTGCARTAVVTVNPLPSAISGPSAVCMGSTITLTDISGGGTWSSGTTPIATVVPTTGVVTGVSAGTVIITYTLPTGCFVTKPLTVNSLPSPISGLSAVCAGGSTISLSDPSTGGTWSSSSPTIATVGSTGIVTGLTSGVVTISYTLSSTGCSAIKLITVNALPVITGPSALCAGTTIAETSTPGGTWVSGTPATATIGSTSGIVTGVAMGTTIITYTLPTGCRSTTTITVSSTPGPVSGASSLCAGSSTTLTDGTLGGVWTSSSTTTATVGSLSGTVTGVSAGPVTITYSLGSGCTVLKSVTVTAAPAAIGGTATLCAGSTTTLTDATTGGSWTSGATGVATIGTTGVVTGVTAGTATITYTIPSTGCASTTTVTVNPLPGAITGPATLCSGTTVTMTDTTAGGTWSATGTAITIGSTGIVTGVSSGTAIVSYSRGGCVTTRTVTVSSTPTISGATGVCAGATTTLTIGGGGTWTSSAPAIATVGSTTGVVTGITAGTANITCTIAAGCSATVTVTVSPGPLPIGGTLRACTGATTTLTDGSGGGTWTSGSTGIATIGATSGIVTGVAAGTAVITYSLGGACTAMATVTINLSPAAIGGAASLCAGTTTTLTDGTTGGTWTSGTTGVATIGSASGLVTGITAGTTTITYTLPSGCAAMRTETVGTAPAAITGGTLVCIGTSTTLSDLTTGGTWTSVSTGVATIGSASGVVTGVASGTTTISYTAAGCAVTTIVTVNPAPAPISGTSPICIGTSTTWTDPVTGGIWSSDNPLIASVGSTTGIVSGMGTGTATISYSPGAGCVVTKMITVTPLPAAISGTTSACVSRTMTLTDATPGGVWSAASTGIAAVGSGTGIVTGLATGTATISYTTGPGCTVTVTITVNPLPPAISGTGRVCLGATTTLTDPATGGIWTSASPAIATVGSASGIVTGVSGGVAVITYTLTLTGCGAVFPVTVNTVPAITGVHNLCAWGDTLTIHDAATTGLYSSTVVTIANLGSGAGRITTSAPGTSTLYYTLPSGCTTSTTMTVNPIPGPIFGTLNTCVGSYGILHDTMAGGVWTSGTPAVATVGSSTGAVAGLSAGTTYVTYTMPATGCKVDTPVHVISAIPPITVITSIVIIGTGQTFSDAMPGGVWTSSNPAIATVGSTTGWVTGISSGIVTITYTIPSGCNAIKTVTVQPLGSTNPDEEATTTGRITVQPNPNKGAFNITGTLSEGLMNRKQEDEEVTIELTDMLGRAVYTKKTTTQNGYINEQITTTNLANGMYLLSIQSASERRVVHVVIRQ